MSKLTAGLLCCALICVCIASACGGSGGGNTTPGIFATIAPAAAQSMDQGQSLALTASVAGVGGNTGVTWSVAGGGTLSGNTASGVTYTAPATVAAATTVTITATSVAAISAVATHTIVVNPAPAISSSGALPAAPQDSSYSATLTATGGAGGLSWSVATGSTLPAGLALSQSGVLSGTPTAAGTSNFSVQVTDASAATPLSATAALSLTVSAPALTVTAPTLAGAVQGQAYTSAAFSAAGGTGAITWTATGLPAGMAIGASSGVISGTPTAAGTFASVVVTATDSGAGAAQQTKSTAALSLTITPALALTTTSLPAGTYGTAYSATLAATGGVAPFTWSSGALPAGLSLNAATGAISGTPTASTAAAIQFTVKDAGTPQQSQSASLTLTIAAIAPTVTTTALPGGFANLPYTQTLAANSGGQTGATVWTLTGTLPAGLTFNTATGVISGTPTTAGGPAALSATVSIGGVSSAAQPLSLTVASTYAVSGTVRLVNVCGSNAAAGVGIAINTTPVQTAVTDSNGNFSFAAVPNGAYTLTPSVTGPSAAFAPATLAVTVNSAASQFNNFNVDVGYNVSGTVAYAGSQTGRIYLTLASSSCGSSNGPGVSVPAPGAFTIRGVPPGTYTLEAGMDAQGTGHANALDPAGSTANISVAGADATGISVTLADAGAPTLAAPVLKAVFGMNHGAIAEYGPSKAANGVEAAGYTLQWSTTLSFTSLAGTQSFPANGKGSNLWLLNTMTDGSVYYFRAYGTAGAATSPASNVVGPVTIGATTGGNTVSGTVTFPGSGGHPLYAVFYDPLSGAVFAQYIPAPASPQAFSVQVPNGSYQQVGILDANGNGIVDAGDVANLDTAPMVTVTGATTANLTLAAANSTATVTTQHYVNGPDLAHSLSSYSLTFAVNAGQKLPVAVALVSGPNVAVPMDLGQCLTCGGKFQYSLSVGSTVPRAGDTYGLQVTYSDGTAETLSAAVSAVVSGLPTNLAPATTGSGNTTPTFTWTDPANAASYSYSFQITDSSSNAIWQIPGANSAAQSFASSLTSITWGTDPTGNAANVPTVAALTVGNMYFWTIQVRDANGNTATWMVNYQP